VNFKNTRAFVFDRVEREAMAVSRLSHRYIVPIDGIGTVDGRWCIKIWRSCRACWWCFTRVFALRDAVEGAALFDSAEVRTTLPRKTALIAWQHEQRVRESAMAVDSA
jgi:hypothetical protein